jgi:hypothetical protein
MAGDGLPRTVDLLIDDGGALDQVAASDVQHEIAFVANLKPIHSLESQRDHFGVRTGGDHKVVFQLPGTPVKDEVDAGVGLAVPHLAVMRDFRAPFLGIAPDKVIAVPRQFIESFELCLSIRSNDLHPHHGPPHIVGPKLFLLCCCALIPDSLLLSPEL